MRKAYGYLAEASRDDANGRAYIALSSQELQTGNASLSQAGGYFREVSSRLNIAKVVTDYEKWGEVKLNQTLTDLKRVAKPRTTTLYGRG
jgi:hypothetical protein